LSCPGLLANTVARGTLLDMSAMESHALAGEERIYYRDRIRRARYVALADAEGFLEICYAIEELGTRLVGSALALGPLKLALAKLVSCDAGSAPLVAPALFSSFDPLYEVVREARNDAMHTGAYARRAASKGVELCLLLEDALMIMDSPIRTVADLMIREPVCVEPWHPVAHARRLMLMHSFSNLPIWIGGEWRMLTELGLARYLAGAKKAPALGASISSAADALRLVPAPTVRGETPIDRLLAECESQRSTALWVVVGPEADGRPLGVISAFELI
jgi:CBS domain-containing protein